MVSLIVASARAGLRGVLWGAVSGGVAIGLLHGCHGDGALSVCPSGLGLLLEVTHGNPTHSTQAQARDYKY